MARESAGGGRHALLHPFLPLLHDDTRPTTAAPTRPRPAALDAALATALESTQGVTHASPSAREAHRRATSHTSCTLSTEACANVRAHAPNNSNKIGRLHRSPRAQRLMQSLPTTSTCRYPRDSTLRPRHRSAPRPPHTTPRGAIEAPSSYLHPALPAPAAPPAIETAGIPNTFSKDALQL